MRYYSRLKQYKNSSGTNVFNAVTQIATSYDWWIYLKRINGRLVFNNYTYSNTTAKHQSKMRQLLRQLGLEIDLFIEAPNGLQDLNSAIQYYNYKIKKLDEAIDNPKSKNETNVERLKKIEHYMAKIETIKMLQVYR